MTKGLKVIAPTLLEAAVCVDARIASCAGKVLVLAVWNVLARPAVTVLFRQTEINDIQSVAMSADAHHKVVRLDIAVNKILIVYILNISYHLVGQHQHRLHCEAARAEVEQIFKARSEKVHYHGVVLARLAEPANEGYALTTLKKFVQFALVQQLWMTGLDWFQFNGHLVAVCHVHSQVDVAKRSTTDLANQAINALRRLANKELLLRRPSFAYWIHSKTNTAFRAAVFRCPFNELQRFDIHIKQRKHAFNSTQQLNNDRPTLGRGRCYK